jgi:hypothetical protein
MTLEKFIAESGLADFDETQKVVYFAFYRLRKQAVEEFSASDGASWVREKSMGSPNISRLAARLKSSRATVRGSKPGTFRLHHNLVNELDGRFPQLAEKSQDVVDDGTILPPALYEKTRGYIESLAKQINASYEHNIFDGCAVLMRRLEEVLLILSYEHLGIGAEIKDPKTGNYFMLEGVVKNAQGNAKLKLSRNGREWIDSFRALGNYSAHRITYQCRREYIREKIDWYRALIEELLHKAGILT